MTIQEHNELDAWIAYYLFGYRWYALDDKRCALFQPANWLTRQGLVQIDSPNGREIENYYSHSHYSTMELDAYRVQKICIQKSPVGIESSFDGTNWFISRPDLDSEFSVMETTFELAICKFAQKIWPLNKN